MKFSALLPGPVIEEQACDVGQTIRQWNNATNWYQQLYQDYVKLYFEFENAANLIRPGYVPLMRTVDGGRRQYSIPALYEREGTLDEIKDPAVCAWMQERAFEEWKRVEDLMDRLCQHDFVHLSSPHTTFHPKKIATPVQYNQRTVAPDATIIEKDEFATSMWYRPSLMRVVMQK